MNLTKKKSTQELIGIKGFTRYGLNTSKNELVFFIVHPTNISVLSEATIEIKIRNLMMVLSAIPDIELACFDSCECFDGNKQYIQTRLEEETNPSVREVLSKDLEFIDGMQVEMSTARQFMFIARLKKDSEENIFHQINRIEKTIAEQSFEVKRIGKDEIKRILAIYFESSMNGDLVCDFDGEKYLDERDSIRGEVQN